MRTLQTLFLYLFTAFFGDFTLLLAQEDDAPTTESPKVEEGTPAPQETPDKVPVKNDEKMSVDEEQNRDELVKSIEEPRISNKWFRGNYLIYDCDKAFYACVNSRSFVQCTDQRTMRIEERRPALGCAPLKRFDSQKECFKVQYEKMQNQVPKLFCVHPNFR